MEVSEKAFALSKKAKDNSFVNKSELGSNRASQIEDKTEISAI